MNLDQPHTSAGGEDHSRDHDHTSGVKLEGAGHTLSDLEKAIADTELACDRYATNPERQKAEARISIPMAAAKAIVKALKS